MCAGLYGHPVYSQKTSLHLWCPQLISIYIKGVLCLVEELQLCSNFVILSFDLSNST